ncbi:response regulator [Maribacter halichondriae]|uniref:response regulator n=1 Tax=Maribacter halichondriae TaxID=2980554 RepID=UPI0023599A3D|nr:response regulator [Maribacter sp. Hal144]
MKSKDLLSKLSVLESLLTDFSYEELRVEDAALLKKSYQVFKDDLETMIFGKPTYSAQNKSVESEDIAEKGNLNLLEGKSVLVFEDDPLNRHLIRQQFKMFDCEIHMIENAHHGVEILEKNKIDLVIMDLRMPGMTGFEATDLIRKHNLEEVRNVPIIAISADFSENDEALCVKHGINDFILKPYKIDQLLEKIGHIFGFAPFTSNEFTNTTNQYKNSKVDFRQLLDDCMGDIELLNELIRLFKLNVWEFIGATKIYLQDKNFEQLKFEAHKLKNGLAMINAHSLQSIIFEFYEVCLSGKDLERLADLKQRFIDEYQVVEKTIDSGLSELLND